MKTIGILGGLGPESTMAYYAYITRKYHELRDDYAYPEILIHSFNFQDFIKAGYELPERIKAAIEGLHRAGADFVVASCNSLHIIYEQVARDIPIPWLSIMDATAERIKQTGLRKVALLGTVFTTENDFYHNVLAKYDIEVVTPPKEACRKINRIIYSELVKGEVKDNSRRTVLEIIEELGQQKVKGIVLGCTELPFLIEQKDTSLKLFDATTIHAHKALEMALGCNMAQ